MILLPLLGLALAAQAESSPASEELADPPADVAAPEPEPTPEPAPGPAPAPDSAPTPAGVSPAGGVEAVVPADEASVAAPVNGFAGPLGLGFALRLDLLAMTARPFGVTAGDGTASGIKGFSGGALVQAAWCIPIPGTPVDRVFGLELDVGYALSGTSGTVSFTQHEALPDGGFGAVTTTYEYGGLIHQIPASAGIRARLPLTFAFAPISIDGSGGFSFVYGISDVAARVQGEDAPFTQQNVAADAAYGYYLEAGLAWALGPGEIVGSYRYSSAFLKFGHDAWNELPGDLGGHHVLFGYRFVL